MNWELVRQYALCGMTLMIPLAQKSMLQLLGFLVASGMAISIPKFLRDLTRSSDLFDIEGRLSVTRAQVVDNRRISSFFRSIENDPGDPSGVMPQYDLAWWDNKSSVTDLSESALAASFEKHVQQVC